MTTWASIGLITIPNTLLQMTAGTGATNLVSPTVMPMYKMQGYYVAGAVWETWTAFGYPATTPPSGHTLTNISYIVLTPSQPH